MVAKEGGTGDMEDCKLCPSSGHVRDKVESAYASVSILILPTKEYPREWFANHVIPLWHIISPQFHWEESHSLSASNSQRTSGTVDPTAIPVVRYLIWGGVNIPLGGCSSTGSWTNGRRQILQHNIVVSGKRGSRCVNHGPVQELLMCNNKQVTLPEWRPKSISLTTQ